MRTSRLRWALYLFTLFFASGCTDATLPVPERTDPTGSGSQPRSIYTLPEVVATIPKCDKYTDLNFCAPPGPGQCMADLVGGPPDGTLALSCIGGGTVYPVSPPGGGGSSGAGPATGPGPGVVPTPETASRNDEIPAQDTLPNCSRTQTAVWAKAYCRSQTPSATQAAAVSAAFDRIEQRGPECALIAAEGRRLAAQGRIRLFEPVTGDPGGWGSPTVGVLIASYWVDNYATAPTADNRNLDHTLAHEVEHVMRRSHVDSGYETPNSRACSGLSAGGQ